MRGRLNVATALLLCIAPVGCKKNPEKAPESKPTPVVATKPVNPKADLEHFIRHGHQLREEESWPFTADAFIRKLGPGAKVEIEHTRYDTGPLNIKTIRYPGITGYFEQDMGWLGIEISSQGYVLDKGLVIGVSSSSDVIKVFGPEASFPHDWWEHDEGVMHIAYFSEEGCIEIVNFTFDEDEKIFKVQFVGCIP